MSDQKERVVAIVSGGVDSVTLLTKLIREDKDVMVLNFSYGSKHNEKERAALLKIGKILGIPIHLFDLPLDVEVWTPGEIFPQKMSLLRSNLLKTGEDIPEGHYAEPLMKQTVVPFRNGIMLAIAVGFAESYGCTAVYYGNHAGDHQGYPDCRSTFVQALGQASVLGTFEGIEIRSPYVKMTKADIVKLGVEIGAPLELTWSCYKGGDRPCLKCGTCEERILAFYTASVQDPALTDEEWEVGVENMLKVEENWNCGDEELWSAPRT